MPAYFGGEWVNGVHPLVMVCQDRFVTKAGFMETELRTRLMAIGAIEGGPLREQAPLRWWRTPTWRCTNHHVSSYHVKTLLRKRICTFQFCGAPVYLTFPGDRSGPLVPASIRSPAD